MSILSWLYKNPIKDEEGEEISLEDFENAGDHDVTNESSGDDCGKMANATGDNQEKLEVDADNSLQTLVNQNENMCETGDQISGNDILLIEENGPGNNETDDKNKQENEKEQLVPKTLQQSDDNEDGTCKCLMDCCCDCLCMTLQSCDCTII